MKKTRICHRGQEKHVLRKSGQVLNAAERPKEEDRVSVGYRNMEFLGLSKNSFGDIW